MQPPFAPPGPAPRVANPDLLPDHPRANSMQTLSILALVLSLVGLGVLAPVALGMTLGVRKAVRAAPGMYRANGPLQVALVCSIVATVVFALATIALLVLVSQLVSS